MKRAEIKKMFSLIVVLILIVAIFLFLSPNVLALGTKLLCLEKGETVRFSLCNKAMRDKVCQTTNCQICVNEIRRNVFCPININECDTACTNIDEESNNEETNNQGNTTAPGQQITLISPESGYTKEEPSQISFLFQITQSYTISSCSLVIDDSEVALTQSRIQSKTNKINYILSEGLHEWGIKCKTRDGKQTIKSATREITIGSNISLLSEEVVLINPEDNFTTTGTQAITFVYNLSEGLLVSNIKQCSLIVDNNTSTAINNTDPISWTFQPAVYQWQINCLFLDNKNISSNTRTLLINTPQTPPQSSDSGGGGGGSGGPIFSKEDMTQNKKNKIEQLAQSNDTVSEAETSSENRPEENMEISDTTRPAGITGAVIGATEAIKNNKLIAISFVIIVIAGIFIIAALRKKQENKAIKTMLKTLTILP